MKLSFRLNFKLNGRANFKTNKNWLMIILCAGFLSEVARATLRSDGALQVTQSGQDIQLKLKEGFHFNEKAPNQFKLDEQKLLPSSQSTHEMKFHWIKNWSQGQGSIYVCDDAQTYCETHQLKIKRAVAAAVAAGSVGEKVSGVKAQEKPETTPAGSVPKAGAAAKKKAAIEINESGFILDRLDEGLRRAKKENKLVIAEFGAPWCPGCVRYEKEIFPTAKFKELTKTFVKVSLNADLVENFKWSEKYEIHGIPAMVILDSRGRVQYRIEDFLPIEKLEKSFADLKNKNELFKVRHMIENGKEKAGFARLENLNPRPNEYWPLKIEFAKKKKDSADLIRTLQLAIESEPGTSRSLSWRSELISALPDSAIDEKSQHLKSAEKLLEKWLGDSQELKKAVENDSPGEFLGYEKLLVMFEYADVLQAGKVEESKILAHWKKAAGIAKDYSIDLNQHGPALRYLITLVLAEKFDEALEHVNRMLVIYKDNFDLLRRKTKILLSKKEFSQAEQLAKSLLPHALGRNEYWVSESLVKAYLGQSKKEEAKNYLQSLLQRPELNKKELKNIRASLETLYKSATN